MGKINKAEIYKKITDKTTVYVAFVEFEGMRFSKHWELNNDFEINHEEVTSIMLQDAESELDTMDRGIGSPVDHPLPEWIYEPGWTKVDAL